MPESIVEFVLDKEKVVTKEQLDFILEKLIHDYNVEQCESLELKDVCTAELRVINQDYFNEWKKHAEGVITRVIGDYKGRMNTSQLEEMERVEKETIDQSAYYYHSTLVNTCRQLLYHDAYRKYLTAHQKDEGFLGQQVIVLTLINKEAMYEIYPDIEHIFNSYRRFTDKND